MIKEEIIKHIYCDLCKQEVELLVSEQPHEGMTTRIDVIFNYYYGRTLQTEHICTDCHAKLLDFLLSLNKEEENVTNK